LQQDPINGFLCRIFRMQAGGKQCFVVARQKTWAALCPDFTTVTAYRGKTSERL